MAPASPTPAADLFLEIRTGRRAGERIAVSVPCAIGRAAESTLCLPDTHLSGAHGRIERIEGTLRYLDRGSTNGSVHVRGEQVTPLDARCTEAELWDGDELRLGDADEAVVLTVVVPEADAGEVVALRPIAEVGTFAGRVTSEPGRLGVLYRFTGELGQSTDLDAVLATAGRLVFELLPRATHLAIALRELGGRYPVMWAQRREGGRAEIPISRTIVRRVLDEKAGVLVTNAAAEFAGARSVTQAGLASTLCVPLWTGAEVKGVLQVDNRDAPGLFSADDLELLTVAAGHVSFAAENARLVARLRLAEQRLEAENRYLKRRDAEDADAGIIGSSPLIRAVLEGITKVRDTRVPVLIHGETGTGKELVARALHYTSERKGKLFVAQNCSALPESLLESELFGHVRGAFTGAERDKKGLFELADGGTIFLDEIGEMPLVLQAKLLRVVQEGEIWPVGAGGPRRVDVRIVSATHRDLDDMVDKSAFRRDLYYRLHVYPLKMPPLRDRKGDIPVLARHFLERYRRELNRPSTAFATDAMDCLVSYEWPGNVRELQNEIQRVLIGRTEGDLVLLEDLSSRIRGQAGLLDGPDVPSGTLRDMLNAAERVLLTRALRETGNNKTRAAEALGITREGLHKKLARFGMST